jgi:hypothetical protein
MFGQDDLPTCFIDLLINGIKLLTNIKINHHTTFTGLVDISLDDPPASSNGLGEHGHWISLIDFHFLKVSTKNMAIKPNHSVNIRGWDLKPINRLIHLNSPLGN